MSDLLTALIIALLVLIIFWLLVKIAIYLARIDSLSDWDDGESL